MIVTSFFTNGGAPALGLSPILDIWEIHTDVNVLVVSGGSMTEVGDGFYKYDFVTYVPTRDYIIRSDGGSSLVEDERYNIGSTEDFSDDDVTNINNTYNDEVTNADQVIQIVNDAIANGNIIIDSITKTLTFADSNPSPSPGSCLPFQLANAGDSDIISEYTAEAIDIAGAPINVYRLLGIHECTRLVDQVGFGNAISSGQYTAFPASNAFDSLLTEWRSTQKGSCVTSLPAYIGYDFGVVKLANQRVKYGIDANVRKHISTIVIKQSCDTQRRISKGRIERSDDGVKWYGVAIITLNDTSLEHTIHFKQSAPSRYWRLSALTFNGGATDFWAVVSFKMTENHGTAITNIQDEDGFLENRDRQYSKEPIQIKGYYEIQDIQAELTRYQYQMQDSLQFIFKVSFTRTISQIGRPLVIGDILEIPSETQYTPDLKPVRRYLEVHDISWATDGYTPGWRPTLQRIIAVPAIASQETRDIFGDLELPSNVNNYLNEENQLFSIEALIADQKVQSSAKTQVPEFGEDSSGLRFFSQDEIDKTDVPISKLNYEGSIPQYLDDGLPPNGEQFTEGTTFPTSPSDGDYHRMTYVGYPDKIPPRLFRYSLKKQDWVFMEEDQRVRHNAYRATLSRYLDDPNNLPPHKIA